MDTSVAPLPSAPAHPRGPASADDAAFLREFLAEHDLPCPSCGYNLRGLPGAACPECNRGLVLQVGLVEPRLGIYIAGLIGWAMGAGLNGLLLVYLVVSITVFLGQRTMPPGEFVAHNIVGGIIQAAGLLIWIKLGKRIRRMSRGPRLALAMIGWAVSLLNVVVLSMLM